jgi:hypothetical protein
VVSGGQITKHQLEHIRVEAAIDFHSSRGAKNRDADSWVAMDASYKQNAVVCTRQRVLLYHRSLLPPARDQAGALRHRRGAAGFVRSRCAHR